MIMNNSKYSFKTHWKVFYEIKSSIAPNDQEDLDQKSVDDLLPFVGYSEIK